MNRKHFLKKSVIFLAIFLTNCVQQKQNFSILENFNNPVSLQTLREIGCNVDSVLTDGGNFIYEVDSSNIYVEYKNKFYFITISGYLYENSTFQFPLQKKMYKFSKIEYKFKNTSELIFIASKYANQTPGYSAYLDSNSISVNWEKGLFIIKDLRNSKLEILLEING